MKQTVDPFFPKIQDGIRFLGINSEGKHVYLHSEMPDWSHLSPDIAQFLNACNGKNSLHDLAYSFNIEDLPHDITSISRLVAALQHLGLLENDDTDNPAPDGPDPLGTVALYLTKACNLRCRYCFLDAGKPYPDELSTGEFTSLLHDLRGQGVETLQWLGGEPTLRRDLFEIAATGKDLGFDMHLLTNGTLVTPESARKIRDHFSGVQVSLDGLREINDAFRGEGSFERITRGIRTLLDAGNQVVVSCVVTRRNIDALETYFEYLAELGATSLHFMNLQSCGRGRDAPSTGVPTFEFATKLTRLWENWRDTFLIPIPKLLKLPRHYRKLNCRPGNGVLEIDPRGRVFPCYFYMERGVAAGSVRDADLAEIYRESRLLNRLRANTVDTREKCRDCDYRYLCGGGCMGENKPTEAFCEDSIRFIRWVIMEMDEVMREQERIQDALRATL